jgi:hypothetical protein
VLIVDRYFQNINVWQLYVPSLTEMISTVFKLTLGYRRKAYTTFHFSHILITSFRETMQVMLLQCTRQFVTFMTDRLFNLIHLSLISDACQRSALLISTNKCRGSLGWKICVIRSTLCRLVYSVLSNNGLG